MLCLCCCEVILTVALGAVGAVIALAVFKRCIGPALRSREQRSVCQAAVLVLGDVGRSPRMQYHAWSIAELNKLGLKADVQGQRTQYRVDLIGYEGEACIDRVRNNPAICLHRFHPTKKPIASLPFIVWAPLKVIFQILRLLYLLLFSISTPDVLLVQTPPAIPTLFVAIIATTITGTRLIVDWHNFGYTILQINLKTPRHPFVRIAYWYERIFSRFSSGNFCVTRAMQTWLAEQWGVRATVLHDQPPDFFHRTGVEEMHELFSKFEADGGSNLKRSLFSSTSSRSSSSSDEESGAQSTLLTTVDAVSGRPRLRQDRPALIVSSTSWTEDEDFGILLDAITTLDSAVAAEPGFPNLVVVVTGKGPQKAMYEARMKKMSMKKCRVVTAWLEAEDYPTLLGCCDLGVSLHYSSSGLDLPMKVLDMFGAGMPVCAVDFACLSELVRDGENGRTFQHRSGTGSGTELADQLHELFSGFPDCSIDGKLAQLRAGVKPGSWSENWMLHAYRVLFPSK